jgi:hypothetical protein
MTAHRVTASYWTWQWAASMMAWAFAQAAAQEDDPGGTPNVLFTSKFGQAIALAQIDSQLGALLPEPLQATVPTKASRRTDAGAGGLIMICALCTNRHPARLAVAGPARR